MKDNLICLIKGHKWSSWDGDEHEHSHSCDGCGIYEYVDGPDCATAVVRDGSKNPQCIEITKRIEEMEEIM